MRRARAARVAALVGLVGGAAALMGAAGSGTGAYFTDVTTGTVNGSFGTVTDSITAIDLAAGDTASGNAITWNNMLPGTDKNVSWTVKNTGSAAESIWLAFPNTNGGWFNADGNSGINNLGTYGDAQIHSPLLNANYDNLNNLYPQGTPANPGQKNACGDPVGAIAYLPAENHVADLAPGASATFTFSFGYTACLSKSGDGNSGGGPAFVNPLEYDIVATQQGITPDDSHNGGVFVAPAMPGSPFALKAGQTWNY